MTERTPRLEIIDQHGSSRQMDVASARLIVGRSPDSQVCLQADGVSRHHAELVRDPGGRWWLRDLNSRNGTRINGQKVTELLLHGGERIAIGPCVVRLLLSAETAPLLSTIDGDVPLTSDEPEALRSLAEMPAPHVQAAHLSRLIQFGRELGELDDSVARLGKLCELMTGGGFPGRCAVAVRVNTAARTLAPMMLLPPVYGRLAPASGVPYLSGRVLGAVVQRRAPVMASSAPTRSMDLMMSMAAKVEEHAAIACPIGAGEQTLDILYVIVPAAGGTGEWLAVANLAAEQYQQSESLWSQRAMAAEHAAIQSELAQALKVQGRLVPRDVKINGLDWAVQFRPCRWVGGDYVDVLRLNDEKLVLMAADVCGHGMQAALLASTLHAIVHVLIPAQTELSVVMGHLNDYLCQTLEPGMFVTAMGIELNQADGKCRAISAGHPPPFVIQRAGRWRSLRCGEYMPLGVESGETFAAADDDLPAGDFLALYTDGLFEVRAEGGELLGIKGLGDKLAAICPGSDASAVAAAMMKTIDDLQDGALATDDQSLIVLRRN